MESEKKMQPICSINPALFVSFSLLFTQIYSPCPQMGFLFLLLFLTQASRWPGQIGSHTFVRIEQNGLLNEILEIDLWILFFLGMAER